ncbi:MAG: helix-turn-helix domain-containing protein [Proteobacteria bacterium]|nr:helix-turn-helix domain-containing protein [Pseudomonadota bacterium]
MELTAKEVATRLNVTPRAIQDWVRRGYFPNAYKVGPGKTSPYRIPEKDVVAFEENRKQSVVPYQK